MAESYYYSGRFHTFKSYLPGVHVHHVQMEVLQHHVAEKYHMDVVGDWSQPAGTLPKMEALKVEVT